MVTARITTAGKGLLNFSPTVEFLKDGKVIETVTVPNLYPFESVYGWIRTRITMYEAVAAFDETAVVGDVAPDPNPDEAAEKVRLDTYSRLVRAEKDLALKVIQQADYDAVLAEYKALR